jgi:serine/threonine protein kinase
MPNFKQVKEIFLAAVERADPQEQEAYLRQACGDDAELRRRVEALLRRHQQPGGLLEQPAVAPATMLAPHLGPRQDSAGTRLGPYKLLQLLGEGGMGAVWMAEQQEPVHRLVAVKVIRAGLDSGQAVARFEAERQALALMNHPNIAQVLDGGATEDGQPYLVMELVKGTPITRYCDDHRLPLRQRLELFVPVCQAIQHAHQKGIIHRDIKPSNILVAPYDDRPVIKVIDFGVAKAAGQRLTDRTLFTEFGAVVGTPEYMSPEQAQLNNQDIDTRSDVYALGVLLYELLTGTTPITAERLQKSSLLEVLRAIREEEPPRPSIRLGDSTEALPAISAQRQTDPAKLPNLLRGELDWIVMKCLEKERGRRYDTANSLARDLQRYLNGEPVEACPPKAAYRLKKFVGRNRGAVVAAGVLLVSLLAGLTGTSAGLVWAVRERDAREAARKDAVASEAQARARLTQIEKGNAVLAEVFADLDIRQVRANAEPLEAVLARRLVRAAEQLDVEAVGDPLVVAALRIRLGRALKNLGYAAEAIPLIQKARDAWTAQRGPDHPDTLASMAHLADAYRADGQFARALPLLEDTLTRNKARLGPEHPSTLACMGTLAQCYQGAGKLDRAVPLFEETLRLEKARLGPEHPETLSTMGSLAWSYRAAGQLTRAVPLFEETLKLQRARLGREHPDTLSSMSNLALGYLAVGRTAEALPLFEEALKLQRTRLGPDHPYTLLCMNNLALGYQAAGKLDLALPLFEETLARQKARLGPDHLDTVVSMGNLADAYGAAGKLDRALPLLEETLALRKAKLGPDHPDTLTGMNNLAWGYRTAGKLAQALPLFEEAAQGIERRRFQHEHAQKILASTISAYREAGQFDPAEAWQRKWLTHLKERDGAGSAAYANELGRHCTFLVQRQKWTQAEPALREYLALVEKRTPNDWRTFKTRSALGAALLFQQRYADAEPLLRAGYEGLRQRADTLPSEVGNQPLREALERLAQLYDAWGKPDEAARWRTKLETAKKPSKE